MINSKGQPSSEAMVIDPSLGLPSHYRWLKGIVAFVFIMNVLDGIFTIIWVVTGKAVEANPLMANLINMHPVLFMGCKLLLVFLGSALLWRRRNNRAAVISIFIVFLTYYILLLYHLRSMNIGLLERIFG